MTAREQVRAAFLFESGYILLPAAIMLFALPWQVVLFTHSIVWAVITVGLLVIDAFLGFRKEE